MSDGGRIMQNHEGTRAGNTIVGRALARLRGSDHRREEGQTIVHGQDPAGAVAETGPVGGGV